MTKKVKLKINLRLIKKRTLKKSSGSGSKRCRFCNKHSEFLNIDFKNASFLKSFLTERGKILGSRISGNCAKHQRFLSCEIKKSRTMALLPYTGSCTGL